MFAWSLFACASDLPQIAPHRDLSSHSRMTLRDLLKKKEKLDAEAVQVAKNNEPQNANSLAPPVPEFTFVRTTTNDQEVITLPTFPGDEVPKQESPTKSKDQNKTRRLSNLLHRPKPSPSSSPGRTPPPSSPKLPSINAPPSTPPSSSSPPQGRRRSSVLNIGRKRASSNLQSENVPENLPEAPLAVTVTPEVSNVEEEKERQAQAEARWERRATLLAETQSRSRSRSVSNAGSDKSRGPAQTDGQDSAWRPGHTRKVSDQQADVNIQEAVRLHEEGELEKATEMFGKLADPNGASNALAQVLYGLSLRHGWGCIPDADRALTYLSYAASNSAAVESEALSSGAKTGGAAKGELVLAIFELGNCFRYGWGTAIDKAAARQYYETAANLGDVDAMSEVAWCYLEGFGGPKDKWKAAQYLRRAENKGKKEIGNTWIWKPKYEPDAKHKEPKAK